MYADDYPFYHLVQIRVIKIVHILYVLELAHVPEMTSVLRKKYLREGHNSIFLGVNHPCYNISHYHIFPESSSHFT